MFRVTWLWHTLRSIVASYRGHFSHANSWKARRRIGQRFPWLRQTLEKLL